MNQESTEGKKYGSTLIPTVQIVVPAIVAISVAYFGYLQIVVPSRLEIEATQTAEARVATQTAEGIAAKVTDTPTATRTPSPMTPTPKPTSGASVTSETPGPETDPSMPDEGERASIDSAKATTAIESSEMFCMNVDQIPEGECEALVALYNSTDGPDWTENSGWLETSTPCNWGISKSQITCVSGYVTELDLGTNDLNGTIPSELGNLTRLKILNLSNNNLVGPIPSDLGKLRNLELLELHRNRLSGPIPSDLGNLRNLRELSLGQNENITGGIPLSFVELELMHYFYFDMTDICVDPLAERLKTWLNNICANNGGCSRNIKTCFTTAG